MQWATDEQAHEEPAGRQPRVRRRRRRARVAQPARADVAPSRPTPPRCGSSPPTTTSPPQHWIAVTPPRIPELRTLQDVVGSTDPVLLDWLVGLAFPCQRPFGHQNGVTEVPKWRILPDRFGAEANSPVMDYLGGGPLGITELLVRADTRADLSEGRLVPRLGCAAEIDAVVPERPARAARPRHRDAQRVVEPGAAAAQLSRMATQRTRARRIPLSLVPARTTRLIAIIAGIAGLAALRPHPAAARSRQTTATILWPQAIGSDGLVTDVTAPLVSGAPLALDVVDPVPGGRDPARRGRPGVLHHPARGHRRQPQRPVRPRQRRHRRRRIPRLRRRRRAPQGRRTPARAARCTSGPTPAASAPTSSASPAPRAPCRSRRSRRSRACSPT